MTQQAQETRARGDRRISPRAAAWSALSIWLASITLFALTGMLAYLTAPIERVEISSVFDVLFAVLFAVLSLSYPTMGALIISRRPNNAVGWIFCATGLLIIGTGCATAYTNYSMRMRPESLPGTSYTAWLADSGLVFYGMFLISALLLLLYPDGHLVSRGWQVVVWVVIIGCATWTLAWTTEPGPLSYPYRSIDNPFGVEGSARAVLGELDRVGILFAFFGWVAAGVSWVYRWDRAEGIERQQIKWFAYSFLLIVVSFVQPWYLTPFALALLPVATGIAILRHHLYDIDVIINRTLVYGALTVSLALVYFGGVTATQAILQAFTDQEGLPQLVIVASTLTIAALFHPLRRRIQGFIDQRFYRRKYDAGKTLEAFSTKLRDETDLQNLNEGLVGVVKETMQPAHAGLWLIEPQHRRDSSRSDLPVATTRRAGDNNKTDE